jgi:hypothetical protein
MPSGLEPRRAGSRLTTPLLVLKWMGIGVLLVALLLGLLLAFEVIRLLVDPSTRM